VSDSNVIKLAQPEAFSDCLTEILCSGARALLTQAVETAIHWEQRRALIGKPLALCRDVTGISAKHSSESGGTLYMARKSDGYSAL
jgi:hypothetical protein